MVTTKGVLVKSALASDFVVVERNKDIRFALVLVAVMCTATGFLVGDWTAEPRFAEREDSIRRYVERTRADVERLRDSLKAGCYGYIDPDRPRSSTFREM